MISGKREMVDPKQLKDSKIKNDLMVAAACSILNVEDIKGVPEAVLNKFKTLANEAHNYEMEMAQLAERHRDLNNKLIASKDHIVGMINVISELIPKEELESLYDKAIELETARVEAIKKAKAQEAKPAQGVKDVEEKEEKPNNLVDIAGSAGKKGI